MPAQLSGPGVGLPLSPALYPSSLFNGELQPGGNIFTLAPGQAIPVPRGTWWIEPGPYAFVQVLDPYTGVWRNTSSARSPGHVYSSDGFTTRVANLTGCALSAIVTTAGSGYVQSSTTITPSAGNSQWQPIVGGLVNTTISITASGSGYGINPLVFFAPPPQPGVPATGYATMANGTISAITVVNQGAGYLVAPPISIVTNPLDPNYLAGSAIVQATAKCSLTGAGVLAAVLCTNNGAPFTSVPTLTVAGAGASAVASVQQLTTLTGATIAGGAGYNASGFLTTIGGLPSATPAFLNPAVELTGYIPRPAIATIALSGTTIASLSTILDGGMFLGAPTGSILQTGAAPTTPTTITLALGSANAHVLMQSLGG